MTQSPKRGSILSCFFPMNESQRLPGPQARPCLVLGTFPNPAKRNITMAIVAYGTSRKTRANFGFEIRIDTEEKLKQTGLHRETRFTLNRMRILPYTEEYFDFSGSGEGVIGSLPPIEMKSLAAHLDEIAHHSDELNFFRPKDAIQKGRRFDPEQVDEYMRRELTGTQILRKRRESSRSGLYRMRRQKV